jgi:hypothetical protein
MTVRVARTVIVESAPTVTTTHKGADRKRLVVGLAMPGDVVGNIGSALGALQDGSSYFYSGDGRYWYDTQPSLNRTAAERAGHYDVARVWEEVVTRLRRAAPRSTPEFAGVVVAPGSTGDVPDEDAVRLVVVHPEHTHNGKDTSSSASRFAQELLLKRGAAARTMPNSLVLLAADSTRWKELESTTRSYLAWRSILDEKANLDLTHTNEAQAQRQVESTNRTIDDQIVNTWIWGLHATQPVASAPFTVGQQKCDGQVKGGIVQRTGARFVKEDLLRVEVAPALIRIDIDEHLLARWNTGKIRVGDLWEYYARYPYMPRLRDRNVLISAIRTTLHDPGFASQGFALATGYDEETGKFSGLALPIEDLDFGEITDDTLLVKPDLAIAQRRGERETEPASAGGTGPTETTGTGIGTQGAGQPGSPVHTPGPPTAAVVKNVRYSGRVEIDGGASLPAAFRNLVDEVLLHLQQAGPDAFEITLDVRAEKSDGFDASTVRVVGENSRQLRFVATKFQDG